MFQHILLHWKVKYTFPKLIDLALHLDCAKAKSRRASCEFCSGMTKGVFGTFRSRTGRSHLLPEYADGIAFMRQSAEHFHFSAVVPGFCLCQLCQRPRSSAVSRNLLINVNESTEFRAIHAESDLKALLTLKTTGPEEAVLPSYRPKNKALAGLEARLFNSLELFQFPIRPAIAFVHTADTFRTENLFTRTVGKRNRPYSCSSSSEQKAVWHLVRDSGLF